MIVLGISLFAQTTGKLSGTVLDDRGVPVAFANITLQGTQWGTTSGENGRFIIINITPGTYTVYVTAVGLTSYILQDVRISVDETRTIQARLNRDSVEQDELIVKADIVMIHRTGGGGTSISSEEIANTSATDVDGLIAMRAGVSKGPDGSLNVRVGRGNEIVFTVDGMSVSDPVDGGRALSVDMDAIADMKIMTGSFTAEYGNAQSGMVNIVTKDGSERWEGKIEGITDHGHQLQKGSNYDEVKFNFGGPVPIYMFNHSLRSKFTFFLNGAAAWSDTRHRKHYRGTPNEDFSYWITEDSTRIFKDLITAYKYPEYDPYEGRDNLLGFDLGNRNTNNYNFNLKSSYKISPLQKLSVAVRGDRSYNTPFSHNWRYALQHYAESESRQAQVLFTYDHVFDARRIMQLKGSYFTSITKESPRGFNFSKILIDSELWDPRNGTINNGNYGFYSIDRNGDSIYDGVPLYADSNEWTYSISGLAEPRNISGFRPPGTIWDNFIDDESAQYSFRGDYEYQISQIVGMKTGLEVIHHDIRKNQLGGFLTRYEERFLSFLRYNCTPEDSIVVDDVVIPLYSKEDYLSAAYASSGRRDGYKANPMQFAYYLQGKADWEGMIVNLGLRTDIWYLGKDYKILQDDGTYRKNNTTFLRDENGDYVHDEKGHRIPLSSGFKKSDITQIMLSPRLSVSHPISEKQVVHFAYNYQNQLPMMRYIFTSRDSVDAYIQGSGVEVGNPKLKPQITVTYEVGLQQLLSEDYVLGIIAYYKNIYNYVSTKKVTSKQEASLFWYEYISEDYGSARGIDLSLNRRMFNFISGGLAYSLSWANGNNSRTRVQDETTNIREFPLDWDIRHLLNLNLAHRVARGEEFILPYTDWVVPFDDYSISFDFDISSGRPYTPQSLDTTDMLETNSKRMPYTSRANMRFAKNFPTGKTSFIRTTFTIENLFKNTNVNYVYPRTGSPYRDGADITETNYGNFVFDETQYLHDLLTNNPSNINRNRNYILTVGYNF